MLLLRRVMVRGGRAGCGAGGLRRPWRTFSGGGGHGSRKTAGEAGEADIAARNNQKKKIDWDETIATLKRRKGPKLGTPDQNSAAAVASRRVTVEGAAKEAAKLPPPDSWAHLARAVVAGSAVSTLIQMIPEETEDERRRRQYDDDDDDDDGRIRSMFFDIIRFPGVHFLVGCGVAARQAPNTYARPYGAVKILLGMTVLSVTKIFIVGIHDGYLSGQGNAPSARGSGTRPGSARPPPPPPGLHVGGAPSSPEKQQQEELSITEADRILSAHFGDRQ
jgi:hypothetical protein